MEGVSMKLRLQHIMALAWLMAAAAGCQSGSQTKYDESKLRDYANALYNQQLFHQSVAQYEYYLNNYDLDEEEATNLNYIIADIYFERLRDYENALAYYLKIKYLYPDSPKRKEVNKKIVACLERLERSADAQQVLEESVMLDPAQATKKRPGLVVAKIGKREITTGDLDYEISQLPPYLRNQLTDTAKKADFLKQYIATELLYDTAKRQGLDRDREVIEAAFQAKRNIMVQKLLEEEVAQNVSVKEEDVELYYKAHREKYADKDKSGKITKIKSFDAVKDQVMRDLIQERQKQAYERMIQRMMRAEAVEIYEERL